MSHRPPPLACLTLALLLGPLAGCKTLTDEQQNALDIYTETAESYYQQGENDRAIGQAIKGLEIEPDDAKLKLILAWSLQRRGTTEDVQRAERVFREIVDDGDFRARLGLAESLERQGTACAEAADAVESGKRVTGAPDPKARAVELRARAHELWTESESWYRRTLEGQKTNVDAFNGLQRTTALLGRPEESLQWSAKLLESVQADRTFWEQRVRRAETGAREEQEFLRLVRRFTDLEIASHRHAATLLVDLGRPAEAEQHLDAALALAPEDARLHGMRAIARKAQGRWDGAIADAERFMALSKQDFNSPDMQRAWALRKECEAARDAAAPRNKP